MLKLPELPLDEKIVVHTTVGVISPKGKSIVNQWLADYYYPMQLPEWWDYRSKVDGKGKYVGSFCKRVAKYFYKEHNLKILNTHLGLLGSLISNHINKNDTYILEYTHNLDWKAGDFGDDKSCFWTGHQTARRSLKNGNAWAVRFYENMISLNDCYSCSTDVEFSLGSTISRLKGFARAWICHTNKGYVVFNGYGLETSDIARIVAHQLNLSYQQINLTNRGETQELIYINGNSNGKGNGFLIGHESVISNQNTVDLDLEDYRSVCPKCKTFINRDAKCYFERQIYCQCCFQEYFKMCKCCFTYHKKEDIQNQMCKSCRQRYFFCPICYKWQFKKYLNIRFPIYAEEPFPYPIYTRRNEGKMWTIGWSS